MRFADLYARFRGSKVFLIVLTATIAVWIGWNLAAPPRWRFDSSGFERLNLLLSVEASLSVALLIMANDRNDTIQRRQLTAILAILESLRDAHLMELARTDTAHASADDASQAE